ncbi:MAG: hypothetical protein O3B65_03670 [Chloroflexi bacterium]|nr:hypothetical protein [Chloroflexota bacterium]
MLHLDVLEPILGEESRLLVNAPVTVATQENQVFVVVSDVDVLLVAAARPRWAVCDDVGVLTDDCDLIIVCIIDDQLNSAVIHRTARCCATP